MRDVDQHLADAGGLGGVTAEGAVELVVEDEEEAHRVRQQVQGRAPGVRETERGQARHVPGDVPGQRAFVVGQADAAHPVQVVPAGTFEAGAGLRGGGEAEGHVLGHGSLLEPWRAARGGRARVMRGRPGS